MEAVEVRNLAMVEDRHWWFRERRHLLRRWIRDLRPGLALDIGAAGGGNTRVLEAAGWSAVALEYGAEGAELAHQRGLSVVRGDAHLLPFPDGVLDLVVAMDVLEHLPDDRTAAAEIRRVLRPGGAALIAVPTGMDLWSPHDEASGHERRYERAGLLELLEGAGMVIRDVRSWNVLMRPLVRLRRRKITGSDVTDVHPLVNAALSGVIAVERVLPVHRLRGVSVLVRADRPFAARSR